MENNISDRSKDPHLVIWMDGDKKITKNNKIRRRRKPHKNIIKTQKGGKMAKRKPGVSALPIKDAEETEGNSSDSRTNGRSVSIINVNISGIGFGGFVFGWGETDSGTYGCCLLVIALLEVVFLSFLMVILWKINHFMDQYSK